MNVLKAYLPDYLIDEIYMHLHQIHMNELIQEYRTKFKPLDSGGCCTRHKVKHTVFCFNDFYRRTTFNREVDRATIHNYKTSFYINGPKNYRYTSGLNHPQAYR